MRRFTMCTTVALVMLTGVVALGQMKITTMEEYAKLMKSNAQANGAMNKALGSGAYADARMQLTTLRQNYMSLEAFWTERKQGDAIAIVKDGMMRLAALEKMLAMANVDQMAAQATAKQFGGSTCGACHKAYREGSNDTGFRFREGVF
jgi:hypothetical protein